MKRKIRGILLLFVVLCTHSLQAQQKTISGTVTDITGLPLPGVNVILKETSSGTQTDFDGNYTIQASVGEVLTFSFVGFSSKEIEISTANNYDVVLSESTSELQEVVVVGYGSARREDLSSAVSTVSAAEIQELVPSTSIDNILQGQAAGVQVVAQNGKPGQTAFVRVRGIGSINASESPLYIVDGVPINEDDLNAINPADIESLSVLKDAATASIYGSRAANGVVLITTKSGKPGDAQIRLTNRVGWSRRINDNFDLMNVEQKLQYERELAGLGVNAAQSLPGASEDQELINRLIDRETDWGDELLRDGYIQSNNISISGATEKMNYFFTLGHDINTGIVEDLGGFERTNGRLNVSYQAKDWINVGTNISIAKTISNEARDRNNVQNPIRAVYDYNPYQTKFILDDDNALVLDEAGNPQFSQNFPLPFNIAEGILNNTEQERRATIIASAFADINLTENLSYNFRVGGTNVDFREEVFIKPGSRLDQFVGDADNPGSKTDRGSNNITYTVTNLMEYANTFKDLHNIKFSGLVEYVENDFSNYQFRSIGFPTDRLSVQRVAALPDPAAGSNSSRRFKNTLFSYGAFADYNYDSKYILTASVRRDGSSRFGENNRWGTFWSTSGAWNISNEEFFQNDVLTGLKLRASYGTSGNYQIGTNAFNSNYRSLGTLLFSDYNGASTVEPSNVANPDLGWEQNATFDVGLEFEFLNGRISGVLDYYSRTTSDLLLNRPLSITAGQNGSNILQNIGEMVNRGFEIGLNANIVQNEDWLVRLGGNISFYDNEITKLATGDQIERPGTNVVLKVGEEINTFNLVRYNGVDTNTGQPIYLTQDGEDTNTFRVSDQIVLSDKSPLPEFDGGIRAFVSYKGLSLDANFYYKFGNYIYNNIAQQLLSDGESVNTNQRLDAFNFWRQPGDTNVLPSPIFGAQANQTSDRFLQKGDYIRLRNITLAYELSSEILGRIKYLDGVRFFIQGQNLWTYNPHFDGDPEVGLGSIETQTNGNNVLVPGEFNLFSYPTTRSIAVGVDLKF